jgi:protein-tyrosine phosphatase
VVPEFRPYRSQLFEIAVASVVGPVAGRLATMPHPAGDRGLFADLAALRTAGVDVLVSLQTPAEQAELGLTGEAEAAAQAGLEFRHLPIPDMGVPDLAMVAPAIAMIGSDVAGGRHVVIHCWAGIGRSSTIAAAVLIELGATPTDACATVSAARGMRVPETRAQRDWLDTWARSRPAN